MPDAALDIRRSGCSFHQDLHWATYAQGSRGRPRAFDQACLELLKASAELQNDGSLTSREAILDLVSCRNATRQHQPRPSQAQ